jgi:hypothetical protein
VIADGRVITVIERSGWRSISQPHLDCGRAQADDEQATGLRSRADRCYLSGGAAFVPMMEAANLGNTNNPSDLRLFNSSRFRTVLLQCQMRARSMTIASERAQVKMEAAFIRRQ